MLGSSNRGEHALVTSNPEREKYFNPSRMLAANREYLREQYRKLMSRSARTDAGRRARAATATIVTTRCLIPGDILT